MKVHANLESRGNYLCVKFEDLIKNPESKLRELCSFVGVEFSEQMLNPETGVGSNYAAGAEQKRGFDQATIRRWEQHIPKFYRALIERFLSREMAAFGYV